MNLIIQIIITIIGAFISVVLTKFLVQNGKAIAQNGKVIRLLTYLIVAPDEEAKKRILTELEKLDQEYGRIAIRPYRKI